MANTPFSPDYERLIRDAILTLKMAEYHDRYGPGMWERDPLEIARDVNVSPRKHEEFVAGAVVKTFPETTLDYWGKLDEEGRKCWVEKLIHRLGGWEQYLVTVEPETPLPTAPPLSAAGERTEPTTTGVGRIGARGGPTDPLVEPSSLPDAVPAKGDSKTAPPTPPAASLVETTPAPPDAPSSVAETQDVMSKLALAFGKTLDEQAVAVLVTHQGRVTKKDIARILVEAGIRKKCNEKSLAPKRCPKLDQAYRAYRSAHDVPRGSKNSDGELEAWEE